MNSERWQRVQILFEEMLAQPAAARRGVHRVGLGRGRPSFARSWPRCSRSANKMARSRSCPSRGSARWQARKLPGSRRARRWPAAISSATFSAEAAWERSTRRGTRSCRSRSRSRPSASRPAPRALQRLKREGLLARSVSHPNVCRVYDLGRHGEGEGGGVVPHHGGAARRDARGAAASARKDSRSRSALRIAEQMAAGLGAAHQAGVVHRDFKAANVMLVPRGPASKRSSPISASRARHRMRWPNRKAEPRPIFGTPAYMAPEQVRGEQVGPAADIYALGIVLYEMVTGTLPFPGGSRSRWQGAGSRRTPLRRGASCPELDEHWER